MEPVYGKLVAENKPLDIDCALDIFYGITELAPILWLEERGWRDVKPGEVAPPGVVPSRWICERDFMEYIENENIASEFMKSWMLFIRKPTHAEYKEIQWED